MLSRHVSVKQFGSCSVRHLQSKTPRTASDLSNKDMSLARLQGSIRSP